MFSDPTDTAYHRLIQDLSNRRAMQSLLNRCKINTKFSDFQIFPIIKFQPPMSESPSEVETNEISVNAKGGTIMIPDRISEDGYADLSAYELLSPLFGGHAPG